VTAHLSAGVSALRSHLVDLRLCDVGPLLRFLQLVLQLAQFAQIPIGLFLLKMNVQIALTKRNKDFIKANLKL